MAPPKAEHPYKFLIGTKPMVLSHFCAELVCQVCESSHCKLEKVPCNSFRLSSRSEICIIFPVFCEIREHMRL